MDFYRLIRFKGVMFPSVLFETQNKKLAFLVGKFYYFRYYFRQLPLVLVLVNQDEIGNILQTPVKWYVAFKNVVPDAMHDVHDNSYIDNGYTDINEN